MPETAAVLEKEAPIKKQNQFVEVMKRIAMNKAALFGMIVFIIVVLIAIFGEFLAPYEYAKVDPVNAFIRPCLAHPFGTDNMGRDILSRVLVGAKYSLIIGIGAQLIASACIFIFGGASSKETASSISASSTGSSETARAHSADFGFLERENKERREPLTPPKATDLATSPRKFPGPFPSSYIFRIYPESSE